MISLTWSLSSAPSEAARNRTRPRIVAQAPTQVLTCRIAQLLAASPEKNFRILALTFTNKAADEMKTRMATFVPGLEERANIGTFHSFCGQILRRHGVHLQIKPDFAIYSQDDDRKAVLKDALGEAAARGGLTPAKM